MLKISITLIFLVLFFSVIGGCMSTKSTAQSTPKTKAHHAENGFINTDSAMPEDASMTTMLYRLIAEKRVDPKPTEAIPVKSLTAQQLNTIDLDEEVLVRLGHSSIYMQLAGQKILIDPVFSERASPFSFIGPKRFHQPPIKLQQLEAIDLVIISHDHYDHLDKSAIKELKDKVKHFVVPLGVDQHLIDWGVAEHKITALDWWENAEIQGVKVISTPTQHFSGRTLTDRNKTLWSSYVLQSATSNLYFSGDSGYFSGFKEIGDRFGPFDITMVETGAYDKNWPGIHMTPEQSLQAHLDLQGKVMLPIHNGTFDLAFHSWYEPLQRISVLAEEQGVTLATPIMGSILNIQNIPQGIAWWHQEKQIESEKVVMSEVTSL